jgi:mRNA interferase RelE/StbE
MPYRIVWNVKAWQELLALDRASGRRIAEKVETHLALDPTHLGKALTGILKGFRRYRVGDYRILYVVAHEEIRITIVRVGHRRDVYRDRPPEP